MKEGDSCTAGDAICEIETDKASMAFEVQDDFYIAKILAIEGQEVKVGDPVFVSVENEGKSESKIQGSILYNVGIFFMGSGVLHSSGVLLP